MEEINNDDIDRVQKIWAVFMDDEVNSGITIVKTFIDRFNYYSNFPRFENLPRDTIDKNDAFLTHCSYVMRSINSVVTNLHNPSKMNEILTKLGKNHGKRGIKKEQFENLIVVIMDILKSKTIVNNMDLVAWKRVLHSTFSTIENNL